MKKDGGIQRASNASRYRLLQHQFPARTQSKRLLYALSYHRRIPNLKALDAEINELQEQTASNRYCLIVP